MQWNIGSLTRTTASEVEFNCDYKAFQLPFFRNLYTLNRYQLTPKSILTRFICDMISFIEQNNFITLCNFKVFLLRYLYFYLVSKSLKIKQMQNMLLSINSFFYFSTYVTKYICCSCTHFFSSLFCIV